MQTIGRGVNKEGWMGAVLMVSGILTSFISFFLWG